MIYLILAVLFFCFYVISHILFARCGLMAVQLPKLLSLSLLWLIVYSVVLSVGPGWISPMDAVSRHGLWGAPLVFTSMGLYLLLCLSYIVECNLIPYGSPSMKILEFVNRQAAGQATYGQLKEFLAGEKLILTRLDDLVAGGYVSFDGARYVLQPRGARVACLMKTYRGILRREAGG